MYALTQIITPLVLNVTDVDALLLDFPELCLELFPTKELTIPDSQRTDEINGKPCNINDIISEK